MIEQVEGRRPNRIAQRIWRCLVGAVAAGSAEPAQTLAGQQTRDEPIRFSLSASFGYEPEEWISILTGLAASDGEIVLYDGGIPEVVVLDSNLRIVRRFGREGGGPGEFGWRELIRQPFLDRNEISVDRTGIVVHSGRELEAFSRDGKPSGTVSNLRGAVPFSFGVRFIAPAGPGSVLMALDSFDITGNRPRRFQTWRVAIDEASVREKLWELPVVEPPTVAGGLRVAAEQARPLWAASGEMVVFNDGASDTIKTFDLAAQREGAFVIPQAVLPDAVHASGKGTITFQRSGVGPPVEITDNSVRPTALMRWAGMTIAPDGKLWLQVASAEKPVAVIFDLHTGAARRVRLPAFPRAFDGRGGFYAATTDSDTDLTIISHYIPHQEPDRHPVRR